jgi:hypothetical protein
LKTNSEENPQKPSEIRAEPKGSASSGLSQTKAKTSSPISYLLSSSPEKKEPPPNARSNHPAFKGQRILVFDWMVEDLMRMLDPHGESFDLHEWFLPSTLGASNAGKFPRNATAARGSNRSR